MSEAQSSDSEGHRSRGTAFLVCGTAFLALAALVAIIHAIDPVTRGWWLVAFLSLVGGAAQILLGWGLAVLVERSGAAVRERPESIAQLVLWNGGTVTVAVADLAPSAVGVFVGGVLLVVGLVLFAATLRSARAKTHRADAGWVGAYIVLLAFLGISVVVGILLAFFRGR